jgi:branched-subunit amino acid aminotransferase/4-amino-4-deoxychorismate lyase
MRVMQNGVLVPIEESDCNDKGWMSGNGVFETIKTVDNKPWALSRHMRRAVASSQQIGFRIPSEDLVRKSVEELCLAEQYPVGLLRLSFGHNGNWSAVHLPYEPTNQTAKLLTYDQAIAVQGQPIKSYPYDYRLVILEAIKVLGADEAIVVMTEERFVKELSATCFFV